MHAITKHYGLEEAIRLAVNAGVDILTFSNNIQGSEDRTVDKVHAIIKKFVVEGRIPESRIDQSFHRIMMLKKKMGSSQADYYRAAWVKSQQELEELEAKLMQSEAELQKQKELKKTNAEPESKSKKKKKSKN